MLQRLVLFDIDGTILWTDGAGRRAIHAALSAVFGATGPADYWFDGKTDRQIVRDLMRLEGHEDPHIDERMDLLLLHYVERLRVELDDPEHPPHLYDGVPALLDALEQRDDVTLGLLTGNVAEGAIAKLEAVGLDPTRFRVGAFGSDHEQRPELPGVAIRRMRELTGVAPTLNAVVVVGDTPADIDCGRRVGARTVAVATGRYSVEDLASHSPDVVLSSLSDTRASLSALLDE